eukprot:4297296-Pleurochrysis_carterae.AAC.1
MGGREGSSSIGSDVVSASSVERRSVHEQERRGGGVVRLCTEAEAAAGGADASCFVVSCLGCRWRRKVRRASGRNEEQMRAWFWSLEAARPFNWTRGSCSALQAKLLGGKIFSEAKWRLWS